MLSSKKNRWITITGVILMLLALAAYLMTMDESNPEEVPEAIQTDEAPSP